MDTTSAELSWKRGFGILTVNNIVVKHIFVVHISNFIDQLWFSIYKKLPKLFSISFWTSFFVPTIQVFWNVILFLF